MPMTNEEREILAKVKLRMHGFTKEAIDMLGERFASHSCWWDLYTTSLESEKAGSPEYHAKYWNAAAIKWWEERRTKQ